MTRRRSKLTIEWNFSFEAQFSIKQNFLFPDIEFGSGFIGTILDIHVHNDLSVKKENSKLGISIVQNSILNLRW
ncbi:hypothetical protein H8356DRAFT_1355063 [Neocallimastix lanati (nom. inval.)]|nr:hypothetical protein H8356DRAFT_1355063 [Neocallimastix sp. JGI-2020a]